MKMMKKLGIAAFAAMLIFTLVTCGGGSGSSVPEDWGMAEPAPNKGNVINIANIQGVNVPAKNGIPVRTITENAQYSGNVEWWPDDPTFSDGVEYTATIILMPKPGYTLQGVPANFFNVAGATYVWNEPDSGFITAVFPASDEIVITSVSINITAPVKGMQQSLTAETSDQSYTLYQVTWWPGDNPFIGGVSYTATVTLMADSGYTFTGLNFATINGENAFLTDNTGTTVTLSYTFPETDTRTVTNIAVINQPNQITYTHGDELRLDGLIVRLTHDDSTADNVSAADFTAHNITTVPAHGNSLARSIHNGSPITIRYGNLTASTNNLTVNPKATTFTVDSIPEQTYTGNAVTPSVTVRDGATILTPTADYTAEYSNNINAGTDATVTVSGAGNYEGSNGSNTFTIGKAAGAAVSAPLGTSSITGTTITINAVTEPDNGQTVEYGKNTANAAPSTGWQADTTLSGLNAGTTYYIFARSAENSNYKAGAASGSLSVTTLQKITPDIFEYYWVDQHGSLVTTSNGAVTVAYGSTLAITAQSAGYDVKQWYLNGANTGQNGNTYSFSGKTPGKYTISLFVEKDGKLYNTNITITVMTTGGTVTFNVNSGTGTTPSSQSAPANNAITLPAGSGLTRSGYTFGGWNTNTGGTGDNYNAGSSYYPNGSITLYARWLANRTVTFNVNGGTGTAPASQTVPEGAKISLPSASGLTRTGYNFGGWNTLATGLGTTYNTGADYYPTANTTTLYALWTSTVTFDVNTGTGTAPASQTVPAGAKISLPTGSGLTKASNSFSGWNTLATGSGTNYNAGDDYTPAGNITLYARWLTSITVTFNANGGTGTVPPTQTVGSGANITLPYGSGLTRSGYTFGGWNTNTGGTGTNYTVNSSAAFTSNTTLYARWYQDRTITYNANTGSGTVPASQTVIYNSNVTLSSGSELSKSGYTLLRWNTAADGSGTNYATGSTWNYSSFSSNIILYAQWVQNVTVTFNLNNGTGTTPSSQTVAPNSNITLPDSSGFSRTGYVFIGWNTTANGSGINYPYYSWKDTSYRVTDNITLYALWRSSTGSGSQSNPILLTAGIWDHDNLVTPTSEVWYYIPYTPSTNFYIWWNGRINGNGTESCDIRVDAYYDNPGSSYIFQYEYDAYSTPKSVYSSSSSYQRILICVHTYDNGTNSNGTFSIVYNTANTRP